jgi:3-hydroxyisobutyrate dehydrogenase-like beta-hydroxyacid dehydrogenase
MKVGFIGLGRMGRPMCADLTRAGHELIVYDVRTEATAEAAGALDATIATSVKDLAGRSEVVFISVPGDAEDEEVMLGPSGVLAGARERLLVLDTTTIGIEQSRRFAQRAAAAGVDYLDTPVSIIRHVDQAPTMTFMVGGSPVSFERARPILEIVGAKVRRVGPNGSGIAAKLLNQIVYFTYLNVFAESMAVGSDAGLDVEGLLDVLCTSSAGLPNIVERYEEILGRSERKTTVHTARHFLDLARASFAGFETLAPICAAARTYLGQAELAGHADEDLFYRQMR